MVAGGTVRCCRGCAMRYGWSLQEFLRRGLADLADGTYVALLTLTEPGHDRGAEVHAADVSRLLEALPMFLAKQVCRASGACKPPSGAAEGWKPARHAHTPLRLPYAGTREFQKRGAMHTHVLLIGWPRVEMGDLRSLVAAIGLGRANVRVSRTGKSGKFSSEQVAAYLAKSCSGYLAKSLSTDEDAWSFAMAHLPANARLLVHSDSWLPGETLLSVMEARRARLDADSEDAPDPGPMPETGDLAEVGAWARAKRQHYACVLRRRAAEQDDALAGLWHASKVLRDASLGEVAPEVPEVRAAWARRREAAPPFSSSTDTDFSAAKCEGQASESHAAARGGGGPGERSDRTPRNEAAGAPPERAAEARRAAGWACCSAPQARVQFADERSNDGGRVWRPCDCACHRGAGRCEPVQDRLPFGKG